MTLKDADPNLALPVLDGLLPVWPAKAAEFKAGRRKSSALMKALPESRSGSLLALAERWGKKIFFPRNRLIPNRFTVTLSDIKPRSKTHRRPRAAS